MIEVVQSKKYIETSPDPELLKVVPFRPVSVLKDWVETNPGDEGFLMTSHVHLVMRSVK